MVRHIILWKLKEEVNKEEQVKLVKAGLESLAGRIPGMISIRVRTEKLPSSTADAMLDSLFESEEALAGYKNNPLHVEVAETYIRPYYDIRLCLDFEE